MDAIHRPRFNAWLTIPHPWTAEVMGQLDFDTLTFDMQHGLMNYQQAFAMTQALGATCKPVMARLPGNDAALAGKLLDAGLTGVICPMVNRLEEAEAFVRACYYPPRGARSFGPLRAQEIFGSYYARRAAELTTPMIMIETVEALEQLEGIAQVNGLKGLYLGPYDLSVSLGCQQLADLDDLRMQDALKKVSGLAAANDLILGVHCPRPEDVPMLYELGFGLFSHQNDTAFLQAGAALALEAMRRQMNG